MRKVCFVATLFTLVIACFFSAASPAICAYMNPPVLHDTLEIHYLDPTYGWSSYAARGSALWKGVVYISGWPAGSSDDPIYSIDVSDPDNLVYIARSGGAHAYYYNQMFQYEDKLFVAGWGDMLRDYDISNPGHPVFLGDYDRPCEPDPNDPYMPFCYFGWGIKGVDNRVYLTEGSEKTKGLYIVDVSNPSSPTEVSRMELDEGVGGLAVRGSYLYFGNNHHGSVPAMNQFLFRIANISDEANPYIMSTVNLTSIGAVSDVALRGNIAYVSCGGIIAFDISDPTNPTMISRCDTGSGQLVLMGDYAFIATGGNGCQFVNIADPANMYVVYAVYHGSPREYEEAVVGNGRYVYISTTSNKEVEDPPYNVLHAFEVFTQDPDNEGPGNWKNFTPAQTSFNLQYDCDVIPSSANPTWTLYDGSESYASVSGGALRINDNSSISGSKVRWARNWDATNCRGVTVMVRAKCASYNLNGSNIPNITIQDGRFSEEFAILSDKIKANNANISANLAGTQWRDYRITTQGTQFRVYVDESSTPILTGTLSVSAGNRARIIFGSGSSSSTQDIYYDYVYVFDNGAQGPPTPIAYTTPDVSVSVSDIAGKGSLSGINPSTARIQWSTDEGATWSSSGGNQWDCRYEADALPTGSTPSWFVAEGDESWGSVASGVLRVNDNSTAGGSKIKWARDWPFSSAIGATVLARVRCAAVGGDTTYVGNIFVDDGVHYEQLKIMTDRIVAKEAGASCLLDGTQWHTYRVTIKNNSYKVYVDENPLAAINTTFSSATAGSGARVMIGSGASAATQDIYFDYVYYSTDGDLPPGQGNGGGSVAVSCSGTNGTDRGVITALAVPFNQYSQTANKVRFFLKDMAGNTGVSPVYTIPIVYVPPPGPVTNFVATPGQQKNLLTWTNPTDAGFTGVKILFRTSLPYPSGPNDATATAIYDDAGTSYSHTGLIGGTTYYYSAFAHDDRPSYSIAANAPGTPAPSPNPVTNFTATPGNTQNSLTWTNPTDLDFIGTRILFRTDNYPSGPNDTAATALYDSTGTSYLHTGLTNGQMYYYSAFAHNAVPYYSTRSITYGMPLAVPAPGPVTSFKTYGGNQRIDMAWTNPTNPSPTGIKILCKAGSGYPMSPTDPSATVVHDAPGTSCSHTGLNNGTRYYYAAYAYTGPGNYSGAAQSSTYAAAEVNIPTMKGLANSVIRAVKGNVVTAVFTGYFYMQDPLNPYGLKVSTTETPLPSIGQQVDVMGSMTGLAGNERSLSCTGNWIRVTDPGPITIGPAALNNKAVGGVNLNDKTPGVVGGTGAHNVGLLVRVFGTVTQTQAGQYFYVDDGYGLKDGTKTGTIDNVGVRIKASPPTGVSTGKYVVITGIVSPFDSSGLRPQILPLPQPGGVQIVGP